MSSSTVISSLEETKAQIVKFVFSRWSTTCCDFDQLWAPGSRHLARSRPQVQGQAHMCSALTVPATPCMVAPETQFTNIVLREVTTWGLADTRLPGGEEGGWGRKCKQQTTDREDTFDPAAGPDWDVGSPYPVPGSSAPVYSLGG